MVAALQLTAKACHEEGLKTVKISVTLFSLIRSSSDAVWTSSLSDRLQVGIYAEEDKGSLHVQRVTEALKASGS